MSEEFDLSEKMKKINWELTAELHLDDGRQYGGGVWLYFHRDVKEAVRLLKKKYGDRRVQIQGTTIIKDINKIFTKKLFSCNAKTASGLLSSR